MTRAELDRRTFLLITAAGALVSIAPARLLSAMAAGRRRTTRTPDESLQALLAGNARYVANRLTSAQQDLKALRAQTADEQHPFAAVLACADSRVPVELLFDQSIGSVFVTRVAGNIVTPEIVASLEYAVADLGVTAIVVLGHSGCGAIKAAMTTASVPGQISALYPPLRPAVDASGGSLDKAVQANAAYQAGLLQTSSTVCRGAIAKGALKITPAVYDLGTGKVTTH